MYEHRTEFTVSRMAEVLGVSESGYYKWLVRKNGPKTEKELEDERLIEEIRVLYTDSRCSLGRRKMTSLINETLLIRVNQKRIGRLMRKEQMFSKTSKQFCCTTDSKHDNPIADNLIDRDFYCSQPNEKMVSDTTEIATNEGKIYVAGILDLYGRYPVGLAISTHNDKNLVMEAFKDMVIRGYGAEGCILHSDRGSTYTSLDYRKLIDHYGFICSMSGKGDCWDNAPMECFWGKMKSEWLKKKYKTRIEAIRDVYEYVWSYYPHKRPHASNNYKTPYEFYNSKEKN